MKDTRAERGFSNLLNFVSCQVYISIYNIGFVGSLHEEFGADFMLLIGFQHTC